LSARKTNSKIINAESNTAKVPFTALASFFGMIFVAMGAFLRRRKELTVSLPSFV